MTRFGSSSAVSADAVAANAKCPMKATHNCFIADYVQIVCEHSLLVIILMGFGLGLAHCINNANNILSAKVGEPAPTSTRTARPGE